MFSFSRALIRDASLYRGGGWVKCWVASSVQIERLAHGERRQEFVLDLAAGRPDPAVAVELDHLALGLEQPRPAVIPTSVTAKSAGIIWLATNRE